jgi:hypothetical protein
MNTHAGQGEDFGRNSRQKSSAASARLKVLTLLVEHRQSSMRLAVFKRMEASHDGSVNLPLGHLFALGPQFMLDPDGVAVVVGDERIEEPARASSEAANAGA